MIAKTDAPTWTQSIIRTACIPVLKQSITVEAQVPQVPSSIILAEGISSGIPLELLSSVCYLPKRVPVLKMGRVAKSVPSSPVGNEVP